MTNRHTLAALFAAATLMVASTSPLLAQSNGKGAAGTTDGSDASPSNGSTDRGVSGGGGGQETPRAPTVGGTKE